MTRLLTERLHLDRLPPGVREALDSWRFWFTVLAVVIAALVLWSIVNTAEISSTQARQARDDAVKAAQIQAQAQAAYQQCVQSRPELQKLSLHVRGVNDLASVLEENAIAALKATARTDPQYLVRIANTQRIIKAAAKIAAVESFPIPTLKQCRARRIATLKAAAR